MWTRRLQQRCERREQVANRWSGEKARTLERPGPQEGLSDDGVLRDGPERARIERVGPVVAHDPDHIGRNRKDRKSVV